MWLWGQIERNQIPIRLPSECQSPCSGHGGPINTTQTQLLTEIHLLSESAHTHRRLLPGQIEFPHYLAATPSEPPAASINVQGTPIPHTPHTLFP